MNFNNIEDPNLQAFNRSVMFYNVMQDMSKDAATKYASQFSKEDRAKMVEIIGRVKKEGLDVVKAEVVRNLTLPPEELAHG
jgi:hypothetical protein